MFNVEQCEGLDLPALDPDDREYLETNDLAEKILALPVSEGLPAYLAWVAAQTTEDC